MARSAARTAVAVTVPAVVASRPGSVGGATIAMLGVGTIVAAGSIYNRPKVMLEVVEELVLVTLIMGAFEHVRRMR